MSSGRSLQHGQRLYEPLVFRKHVPNGGMHGQHQERRRDGNGLWRGRLPEVRRRRHVLGGKRLHHRRVRDDLSGPDLRRQGQERRGNRRRLRRFVLSKVCRRQSLRGERGLRERLLRSRRRLCVASLQRQHEERR